MAQKSMREGEMCEPRASGDARGTRWVYAATPDAEQSNRARGLRWVRAEGAATPMPACLPFISQRWFLDGTLNPPWETFFLPSSLANSPRGKLDAAMQ